MVKGGLLSKDQEKFICEKEKVQKQIGQIEEKRNQLAGQRNEKKKYFLIYLLLFFKGMNGC